MVSPAEVFAGVQDLQSRLDMLQAGQQSMIESIREMERLRGLKPMRWLPGPFTAAATVTLGLNQADAVPINSGFAWSLMLVAGRLSASDSVAVYIGDSANAPSRLIGYQAAPGAAPGQAVFAIYIPKPIGILNAGETLTLATSGTGLINSINLEAWEVPGEMVGKLY